MVAPIPGTVVLFVAGDPALARVRAASTATSVGFVGRALGWGLPPIMTSGVRNAGQPAAPSRSGPPEPREPIPPEHVRCAQQVLDVAKRSKREVRIVDVNRPGDDGALVARYVDVNDVLPILVRSDGARLEGEEAFTRSAIRRFLAGA